MWNQCVKTKRGGKGGRSTDLEQMHGFTTDARQEKVLSELGLRMVRFGNEEVVMDATRSAVVGRIKKVIAA